MSPRDDGAVTAIWALGEQPSIENFEKLCMALVTAAGEEDSTRFLQQGACVWVWQIAKEKYDWPIDYHLLTSATASATPPTPTGSFTAYSNRVCLTPPIRQITLSREI